MLVTLYFLLLLKLPITYAATKLIYSSDPAVAFSPGWSQQYSQSTQDLYMETNSSNATLTATLPSSATSVSYVGYKRAGGSLYGYCIDCEDAEAWTLQTSNATDGTVTDDDTAVESNIFTVALDPSTQHTLKVYNLPNSQFDNSSEINFDHLYVEVQDNDTDGTPASSLPLTSTSGVAPSTSPSSTATTTSTGTGSQSSDGPGTTTNPLSPSSTSGTANAASSSTVTGKSSSGLSKSVITGVAILAIVFGASVIVGLTVFVRQRQQQKRNSFQSSQPSPTASIIPIMPPPPPEMGRASLNPFSDPLPRPLESPVSSSLMQRRMESRNTSPGSAPSIPLPDPPPAAFNRMESRSNSPASSRSDLWIARRVQMPLQSKFSV